MNDTHLQNARRAWLLNEITPMGGALAYVTYDCRYSFSANGYLFDNAQLVHYTGAYHTIDVAEILNAVTSLFACAKSQSDIG